MEVKIIKNKILKKLKSIDERINFNDKDHTYLDEKTFKKLTPVSNTLEWYAKGFERIPKDILEKAVTRGNIVHEAMEYICINLMSDSEIKKYRGEHTKYVSEGVKYLNDKLSNGWDVLSPEQLLFNAREGIAGTADLIMIYFHTGPSCRYGCQLCENKITELKIVDWKTGSLRASHYAQISLYKYMLEAHLRALKIGNISISTELVSLKPEITNRIEEENE